MPKVINTHKQHSKSKDPCIPIRMKNEAPSKRFSFETEFQHFLRAHSNESMNNKKEIKRLGEEIIKIQKTVLEKNEMIRNLTEKIDDDQQEIQRFRLEKESRNDEFKKLRELSEKSEVLYTSLEISYDQKINDLNCELQNVKEELIANVASQNKELHIANEKCKELQENSNKLKNDYVELQKEFEVFKEFAASEKKTMEIEKNKLKSELQEKMSIIEKCREEKDLLENAKNKVIEEQSYKIKEIGRVFDQPVKRIKPVASNRPKIITTQMVEVTSNQNDISATSRKTKRVCRSNAIQKVELSVSHQQVTLPSVNPISTPPNISVIENEFSSDEAFSPRGWSPVIFQRNSLDSNSQIGFRIRKRTIDETESEPDRIEVIRDKN